MSVLQRIAAWSTQLVARVYLFSSALLIISALVLFGIGAYEGAKNFQKFPIFFLSAFCEHWDEPEVMQARVKLIKDLQVNERVTLYDSENHLILTTVDPPLPPLTPQQIQRLQQEKKLFCRFSGPKFALGVMRHGVFAGYGLIAPPEFFSLPAIIISCIVICAVIGVFSIMFARSLAQPISRLSTVARAFGKGDFTVRTQIKRNDELGYLAQTFDEMADRVNDLLRSQKELLANVSHELRTPLARIRVALDIAAEGASEPDQKQWSDIVQDLEELELLIADIMMATRLDLEPKQHRQAALPLHVAPLAPELFLNSIADRFSSMHQSHVLELSVEGPLPAIMADPRLLRRVMENILDNARKYSRPGSAIAVRAHHDTVGLVVEISDQGIGIAAADIENVFKPFFRADRSRTRSTGGVGLGLTLSQRIIEAHGGSISISSRINSGTTARFIIPQAPQSGAVSSS